MWTDEGRMPVMKYSLIFAILMISTIAFTVAGEKPSLHFTGNPRADFFSTAPGGKFEHSATSNLLSFPETEGSEHKQKSPWLAGALSLAVPGAGEVYTENYLKGAVFFTIEAASWITAYVYNKKGDQQTQLFQDYANAHWSASRYALWLKDHLDQISQRNNVSTPNWDPSVFRNSSTDCGPPFPCVNWDRLNKMEQDSLGLGHALPYWGDQQYYELIGKYAEFSKGWDSQIGDETPYWDAFSANKQFNDYREMFNQADKYYSTAGTWVSVAIANHILSALDAYWSATRYNSSLHAEVRMRMVPTQTGFSPMTEANIYVTF